MRVLQINSHYDQGGAARIVACIHRQLLQDKQESYVAYGRGKSPSEKNVYQFDTLLDVYASAFVSRAVGIHGWSNFFATKRLLRYMDKVQPEVVHMHALHGYYIHFPMFFEYINKHQIPCVWTFHDCYAFTGNCGYYFSCQKWKTGCGNCPNIHSYPNSQFLDFTKWMWKKKKEMFTNVERMVVVTPSEWLTEDARNSFMGKYKCVTVRNGIDTMNLFYPRNRNLCREKYGYKANEKLILGIAVGFDDIRKGAKYVIQLAKDLQEEAKVILIGWNSKNDHMLEGTTNIITLPNTSNAEMLAEYYSMADVFVIPSLAENYATVTLESMACGTPVVGFDVGGIPEQLVHNKGIAVEVGNQEEFNRAVREACSEGNTLLRGEELSELIKKQNSIEGMTKEYMEIYRELLL